MVQHPKWATKQNGIGESVQDVLERVQKKSSAPKTEDSLGNALMRIYARSAELLIERINQLPENYFRAFLDSAGVDLLPPKPANSELTFTLPIADDGDDSLQFVTVPERTQVATQQSETQPEVIFETIEEITVSPNRLDKCITFDPLNYSDQTAKANATTVGEAFTVFKGTQERERILFLGSSLFSYHETLTPTGGQGAETAEPNGEVSDFKRKHTVFDLCFELDIPCLFSLPPAFSELTPGEPTEALRQQFQKNKIGRAHV